MIKPADCRPPRVSLAHLPTPLMPLDRLSERVGGPRIWLKRDDLTGSGLSGNKVRKLEFSIAQALADGCDTIVTCGGIQSNHCRATALACAQLGLRSHLVLRGKAPELPDGNLLLDHIAGATISYVEPAKWGGLSGILEDVRNQHARQNRKAFVIPTGASDEIGLWGYYHASIELAADCQRLGIAPGHIIIASGSGGTQAGLSVGAHEHLPKCRVWGFNVCDDEAWFLNKINHDLHRWQQRYELDIDVESIGVHVIDGYVGPGYGVAEQPVFDCIHDLARTEGVLLDPVYTGKAFLGMLDQLRQGRFGQTGDILFVHTGGAFGLFPQKNRFIG